MGSWGDRLYCLSITSAFIVTGFLVGAIGVPLQALAQPIPDETLGEERSQVRGLNSTIDLIEGGATRGRNLFHSFREFNIDAGQGAYFIHQLGIDNIFSRVTGGTRSDINGVLGIRGLENGAFVGSDANLFLINPNGILFGPNSRLDVGGSFVATTADAIGFGDRGFFSATNPEAPSQLLTIDPSAFFFNQLEVQSIVQYGPPNVSDPTYIEGLRVPDGRSLLLLGGAVTIQDGRLRASGGRVELGGVAGTGTIGLTVDGNLLSLRFPEEVDRANVSITGLSEIDVTARGGGDVAVYARNLTILDGSDICAGMGSSDNCGNQTSNFETIGRQAGDIVFDAQGTIRLDTTANRIRIENGVNLNAVGNAGNVVIQGRSLLLKGDSQIISAMEGQGNSGNISIDVRDRLVLEGVADRGSYVSTETGGRGNAGNINIRAQDIQLSNTSVIFSGVSAGGIGQGGELRLQATSLSLINGAQIGTTVIRQSTDEQRNLRPGGRGRGGSIELTVSDSITLSGTNPQGFSSGVFAFTERGALGQGGEILIETNVLRIANGAVVGASTANRGNAGTVTINVRDLEVIDGGQIVSATRSSGRAGGIQITATGNITISGVNPNYEALLEQVRRFVQDSGTPDDPTNITDVRSVDDVITTQGEASGIFASTSENSTDDGGRITVNSTNLTLQDGALISAQSQGTGIAGDIRLNASEQLQLTDSNIITNAARSSGGDITMNAETRSGLVILRGDSDITTNSLGNGGNITLRGSGIIAFDDSDILARSRDARGGNITLDVFFSQSGLLDSEAPFDGNDRVDIDATGAQPGTITTPDTSLIQNSLTKLPDTAIDADTLLANSCVVRSQEQIGIFIITGPGGLPRRPSSMAPSTYPTNPVRSIPDESTDRSWRPGEAIVEPQGVYQLADGRMVLSRECN
jgi:filamentous hemagglutinin family protein